MDKVVDWVDAAAKINCSMGDMLAVWKRAGAERHVKRTNVGSRK